MRLSRTTAITPSDTEDLPEVAIGVFVGVGGAGKDLTLQVAGDAAGDYRTFKNVPQGEVLRVATTRVLATGTTADGLVAVHGYVGGGGVTPAAPAWVEALRAPSGDLPLIAADFKAGKYWNGAAECAAADLFTTGPIGNGFDVSAIVAGEGLSGGKDLPNSPILKPEWVGALLTDGATALLQTSVPDPVAGPNASTFAVNIGQAWFTMIAADYSAEYTAGSEYTMAYDGAAFSNPTVHPNNINWYDALSSDEVHGALVDGSVVGVHRLAATIRPASAISSCTDGGPVVTLAASSDTAVPDTIAFCAACNPDGGHGAQDLATPSYLEVVALYRAQNSTTLATLSAPV